MFITHNLPALNTYNKVTNNSKLKNNSLEKLSSGQRINKAADDAAGLAISEKMRGQIRGLNMAARNVQDGISLIQTADGAMNEVHSILQRGRELSVQACNGTLTQSERKEIGNEINQLTKEIDRIANSTEFNTKKILNFPTYNIDSVTSNVLNGLKTGWLEVSAKRIQDIYGLTPKNDLGVILEQGTLGGVLADANGSRIRIELLDFAPSDGASGNNPYSSYFAYNDQIVAHELTHSIMMQNMNMSGLPLWFIEGTAEAIAGADGRLVGDLSGNSAQSIVNQINDPSASGSILYSCGYVAVRYMDASIRIKGGAGIIDVMGRLAAGDNLDTALASTGAFTDLNDFKLKFVNDGDEYINGTLAGYTGYYINLTNNDAGALGGFDAGVSGSEITREAVIDESTATDTTDGQPLSAYGINVIWPEFNISDPFTLHIGANAGQNMILELPMVTADKLGLSEIDIETKSDKAIGIFDNAISAVSSSRAKLGAAQNRLEYTLNNLNNAEENLTAAESRIRDADMAKEMTAFTKGRILEQAAQSMLAQANNLPQAVLQLLQA